MIQTPLHEHRIEMSKKFENRVDYVDITAYGVGIEKNESQLDPGESKDNKSD